MSEIVIPGEDVRKVDARLGGRHSPDRRWLPMSGRR